MSETPAAKGNNSSTVSELNMTDESLYTDFANYKEPENKKVQQPPQGSSDQTNKRPNRKDWLDTSNPLHCKPCDFTAKDIQVYCCSVMLLARILFHCPSYQSLSMVFPWQDRSGAGIPTGIWTFQFSRGQFPHPRAHIPFWKPFLMSSRKFFIINLYHTYLYYG